MYALDRLAILLFYTSVCFSERGDIANVGRHMLGLVRFLEAEEEGAYDFYGG